MSSSNPPLSSNKRRKEDDIDDEEGSSDSHSEGSEENEAESVSVDFVGDEEVEIFEEELNGRDIDADQVIEGNAILESELTKVTGLTATDLESIRDFNPVQLKEHIEKVLFPPRRPVSAEAKETEENIKKALLLTLEGSVTQEVASIRYGCTYDQVKK